MSRRSDDIIGVCFGAACLGFVVAMVVDMCLHPQGPTYITLVGPVAGAVFGLTVGLLPQGWDWVRHAGRCK